jgi:hypothetical protein
VPENRRHSRWDTGTHVLVRNRFDGAWVGGFELTDASEETYQVRRRSDRVVLPARFDESELRPERDNR